MDGLDSAAIKDRIDLAAVATGLLHSPGKRQGRYLLFLCPFHDDHHPSFQVDPERRRWDCWPCGIHGDAFDLVMKLQGVAFPEAARIAADLSGIAAPGGSPRPDPRPRPPPASTAGASKAAKQTNPPPERSSGLPLADALALVTEAFERLWTPEGTEALAYLHGRGLKDETIKAARLGWTPGVMVPYGNGDKAKRRCGWVIPWFDGERLAKVQIRQPKGTEPKYAEAFRDQSALYPGSEAIREGRPLVIAEGEFDRLLLAQELRDLAAVVTLGGTGESKAEPLILMAMLAAAVWFIAFDRDDSGDKAADGWPARAIRVRPPDPFNDWTDAARAGVNLRLWWAARLGRETLCASWPPNAGDRRKTTRPPTSSSLPNLRLWARPTPRGSCAALAAADSDPYALAEREAIQQEDEP